MKKIIKLMTVMMIAIGIVGCSSKNTSDSTPESVLNDFLTAVSVVDYEAAIEFTNASNDERKEFLEIIAPLFQMGDTGAEDGMDIISMLLGFDFNVNSVETKGNKATADITIKGYDQEYIFELYMEEAMNLPEEVWLGEESEEIGLRVMADVMLAAGRTLEHDTTITLVKEKGEWVVEYSNLEELSFLNQ
jgi:hypothetical protein